MVILYIKPARRAVGVCVEPIFKAFLMKYVLTWNFVYHLSSFDLV